MENGSTPYIHHSNLELEKIDNRDNSEKVLQLLQGSKQILLETQVPVQQIEYYGQMTQTPIINTPQQHERINKSIHAKSSHATSDIDIYG